MKKRVPLFLCLSLLAGSFSTSVLAETVHVCTSGSWVPFSNIGEKSDEHGLHTQKVIALFEALDEDLKLHEAPWKRCLKMVETGEMDAAYSASYNEERADYAFYPSVSLGRVTHIAVTIKGVSNSWDEDRDLEDLPQPVGSPLGYSVTRDLLKEGKGQVVSTSYDDEQNLRLLLEGKLGSVILTPETLEEFFSTKSADCPIEVLSPPYREGNEVFMILSKLYRNDPARAADLLMRIDKALAGINRS
ncbi:substrate-binding periplasmic protein [Kiloniella sp. b19]|uniref:substrate-binding periplasmic protein n=1 Tax=Kiloniella sp. GXU_MW_B19 TaxID=3141326 RepID=UPI0031DB4662